MLLMPDPDIAAALAQNAGDEEAAGCGVLWDAASDQARARPAASGRHAGALAKWLHAKQVWERNVARCALCDHTKATLCRDHSEQGRIVVANAEGALEVWAMDVLGERDG